MKFETRRERETRRKRQKQSAILGMVLAFALVMIMGAVIWSEIGRASCRERV